MDGAINGAFAPIVGVAYTNNQPQNSFVDSPITTLYTYDGGRFYIQNPPNSGTQATQIIPRFGLPNVHGFDIPPGVNVNSSNGALDFGKGYFTCEPASGTTLIWEIDLDPNVFQPDPRMESG